MNLSLLKQPSAFVPIGLAAAALTLPWLAYAVVGPDPTGDEGAAARLFQLLMAAQVLCTLFFASKWLPREPKQATIVLALQVGAFIVPLAVILVLEGAQR